MPVSDSSRYGFLVHKAFLCATCSFHRSRLNKISEICEIACPLCTGRIRSRNPRTSKQWKNDLIVHLIVHHHLDAKEAKRIANSYLMTELLT
jgi:hypothetical protein